MADAFSRRSVASARALCCGKGEESWRRGGETLTDDRRLRNLLAVRVAMAPGMRLRRGVFTASKKLVPRFLPADVIRVPRCHRSRSWRRSSGVDGCSRRLFCCRQLSAGGTVRGSFGSQTLGRRDDCDTRVHSCCMPVLLVPTARIATFLTSFIATPGPVMIQGQERTLNTPVENAFQAPFRGSK